MSRLEEVIGRSPEIERARQTVLRVVSRVAGGSRVPALFIHGETGTGKGHLARALHRAGPRAGGPFVAVNCAAIPASLVEAELFGYERGAFTDARRAKPGLFHGAGCGMLFLDEVGFVPLEIQAKLLTVLEDGMVRKLGGIRADPVDVWIVSAMAQDPELAVAEGRLLDALYHRLALVTVCLPPLRERGDDVVLLAEHFLARACRDYRLAPKQLAPDARAALLAHPFPGNLRELANVIERAALLGDGALLDAAALGLPRRPEARPPAPTGGADLAGAIDALERSHLVAALDASGGNLTHAAARLGLARNTLRYRMAKHGIVVTRARRPAPAPPPPAAAEPRRDHVFLGVALAGRALAPVEDKLTGFGGDIVERAEHRLLAVFADLEDAPRRAVNAARSILNACDREGPSEPRPRLAIDVAPVEVAALLASSQPGAITVGAGAAARLRRRFDVVAAGGAYRIDGQRSGFGGVDTTFVGRLAEASELERALTNALAGRGRIAGVVGEAGVGKSRLVFELARRLAERDVLFLEIRCEDRAVPHRPVVDLLRRLCGIVDGDGAVEAKVCAAVAAAGLGDDIALHLLRFLHVDAGARPLSPEALRVGAFVALRRLIIEEARRRPVVVAVEDLHWIDPSSEEFFNQLADAIAAAPVLLVATYRPEYRPPWLHLSYASQIALLPLSPDDSRRLLAGLILREPLPEALLPSMVARGEGNPFFLEELALHTAGNDDAMRRAAVPPTIHAVLAARIDRLEEPTRRLLGIASVLGRELPLRVLAEIWDGAGDAESHLTELAHRELVFERTGGLDPVYAFKHALTQEVAYGTLPLARRAELHHAAGRAIERRCAGRVVDQCEALAFHFARSPDRERAVDHLHLANRKAARACALQDAEGYFQEAMALLDGLADSPANRRRRIALLVDQVDIVLLLMKFPEYHALLRRYQPVAATLDDAALQGALDSRLAHCLWGVGEVDAAIAGAGRAVKLCERPEDIAHAYTVWLYSLYFKNELEAILAEEAAMRAAIDERSHPRWFMYALGPRLFAFLALGRHQEAVERGEEMLAIAERSGDASAISFAAWNLARACAARGGDGDGERAVRSGELAVEMALTPGDRLWGELTLAWAWCCVGEIERGVTTLKRLLPGARASGFAANEVFAQYLAYGYAKLGDRERAARAFAESLERAARHGMAPLVAAARRGLVEIGSSP